MLIFATTCSRLGDTPIQPFQLVYTSFYVFKFKFNPSQSITLSQTPFFPFGLHFTQSLLHSVSLHSLPLFYTPLHSFTLHSTFPHSVFNRETISFFFFYTALRSFKFHSLLTYTLYSTSPHSSDTGTYDRGEAEGGKQASHSFAFGQTDVKASDPPGKDKSCMSRLNLPRLQDPTWNHSMACHIVFFILTLIQNAAREQATWTPCIKSLQMLTYSKINLQSSTAFMITSLILNFKATIHYHALSYNRQEVDVTIGQSVVSDGNLARAIFSMPKRCPTVKSKSARSYSN